MVCSSLQLDYHPDDPPLAERLSVSVINNMDLRLNGLALETLSGRRYHCLVMVIHFHEKNLALLKYLVISAKLEDKRILAIFLENPVDQFRLAEYAVSFSEYEALSYFAAMMESIP